MKPETKQDALHVSTGDNAYLSAERTVQDTISVYAVEGDPETDPLVQINMVQFDTATGKAATWTQPLDLFTANRLGRELIRLVRVADPYFDEKVRALPDQAEDEG